MTRQVGYVVANTARTVFQTLLLDLLDLVTQNPSRGRSMLQNYNLFYNKYDGNN